MVWVTDKRFEYFDRSTLMKVCMHLKQLSLFLEIELDYAYGYKDHLHVLIRAKRTQTAAWIANRLKGETSKWINDNGLTAEHFKWRKGYYVVSVSLSIVPKVMEYIKNQWDKHEHLGLDQELKKLFPDDFPKK